MAGKPFSGLRAWSLGMLISPCLASPALAADAPAHRFDLHGYIRTGLGFSEEGATQAEFQAPGTPTRYRLGNEAHTNFEFALDYRHDISGSDAPEGAFIQGYFMMDDFEPFSESGELGLDHTAQAYLKFGSYLAPGVDVWVGRRYYDRKRITMARYHWLNPGQNAASGAGIEGVRLGPGSLNAALFRTEDQGLVGGTINGTQLDLRYAASTGIAGGKTTFWGMLAQRARHETLQLDARTGYGVGLWHDLPVTRGGIDTTALLYRRGAAIAQGVTNPNPVREDQGYDLKEAATWEINNVLIAEPGGNLGLQWAVIARLTDFGEAGRAGSTLRWYSTGIRPVYYLGDHTSIALEPSIDFVDDKVNDRTGSVSKITAALQLTKARGYHSLPALRLFFTHAQWSDKFEGLVGTTPGDAPYGSATSGWTVGTQMETAW